MPPRGDFIFQLSLKIEVIGRVLKDLDDTFEGTQKAVAHRCGISPATLRSSCRSANHNMSKEQQSKLARHVGFEITHRSWIDPAFRGKDGHLDERRDTALHFEEMLRERLDPHPPLRLRLALKGSDVLDPDLATFDVTDAQDGSGSGPHVFFESYFDPGYDLKRELDYGFKRVRITFELDRAEGAEATALLGHIDGVELNGASLVFRGERRRPGWDLKAADGVLEGPFITREDPLFVLLGAKPGLQIKARISVQLKDGVVVKRGEDCVETQTQKAVLKRLIDRRLPADPDRHGWLDLGIQTLDIVAETA